MLHSYFVALSVFLRNQIVNMLIEQDSVFYLIGFSKYEAVLFFIKYNETYSENMLI